MTRSSSNLLISFIRSRWLTLTVILFLPLFAGPSLTLAAVNLPAPPISHSQFIEQRKIPKGLSAADWDGIQQAYLKASNTGADDAFGLSVAVSGNTAVIGAFQEDSSAIGVNNNQVNETAVDSGAAYIFVRTNGVWSQQAYLKASNTGENDQFGRSVAISGDTVVVGARFEDSNATGVNGNEADESALQSGAAYVFTRSGSIWSQQAYLKASNTGMNDWFGYTVAVSGDTVVVGAYLEDSDSTGVNGDEANNLAADSGAAYIFTRSGGVWSQEAYLKASNTGQEDNFSFSLAISGDTVVVGAPEEDSNATGVNQNQGDDTFTSAGAAYVFIRSGNIWSQQAYLKASNTNAGDQFGYSVAVSGDTVIVGAPEEDSGAFGVNNGQSDNSRPASGAAYVFTRSAGTWSQQAYLKASNTDVDDKFGYSVAVSGDTIAVGSPFEESNSTGINNNQTNNLADNAGAAYVFTRSGVTWGQQAYLKASNTGVNDQFGRSAAVSGDTVLVGAFLEDSDTTGVNSTSNESATDSGAAYLFRESFCSNQSGNWGSATTWVGGVPPGSGDDVCIGIGDSVTLVGATAVNSLVIYPDAALDLANFGLTAANGVTNHGTLSQTLPVDGSTSVEFLHIQDGSANTQYRGLTIGSGQNLGNVEVGVRETVNWHPVTNGDGLDTNQYCTNTGSNSPAYAQRCYTINPTNQPTADVAVRLWGLSSELNGITQGNLRVYRNFPAGSSTWVELPNTTTGNDGSSYSYAQADTPGFSDFLLGQSGNAPTAIMLTVQQASGLDSRLVWFLLTAALLLGLVSSLLIRRQAA